MIKKNFEEFVVKSCSQDFRVTMWDYGAFILKDDKNNALMHISREDLKDLKNIIDKAIKLKKQFEIKCRKL